jgi:hypothetical protein
MMKESLQDWLTRHVTGIMTAILRNGVEVTTVTTAHLGFDQEDRKPVMAVTMTAMVRLTKNPRMERLGMQMSTGMATETLTTIFGPVLNP